MFSDLFFGCEWSTMQCNASLPLSLKKCGRPPPQTSAPTHVLPGRGGMETLYCLANTLSKATKKIEKRRLRNQKREGVRPCRARIKEEPEEAIAAKWIRSGRIEREQQPAPHHENEGHQSKHEEKNSTRVTVYSVRIPSSLSLSLLEYQFMNLSVQGIGFPSATRETRAAPSIPHHFR